MSLLAESILEQITCGRPVGLTISSLNGGAAELDWNYGVLQTATNVSGPYSDLTNITPPFMATFTNGQKFFRIKENQQPGCIFNPGRNAGLA